MGDYVGVANDPDVNAYDQGDLQDLTESGIGTGMRGVIVWIGLIVLIVVVSFLILRGKKAIGSTGLK